MLEEVFENRLVPVRIRSELMFLISFASSWGNTPPLKMQARQFLQAQRPSVVIRLRRIFSQAVLRAQVKSMRVLDRQEAISFKCDNSGFPLE
jgi:hypothetical protein